MRQPDASASDRPLRVLVADPVPLFRRGLELLLRNALPGIEIAEAVSHGDAIARLPHWPAEVLLVDVDVAGVGALQLVQQLQVEHPEVRLAALSGSGEAETVLRWLSAGVQACLPRTASPEELCEAMRMLRSGRSYLSATLLTGATVTRSPDTLLTPRQRDVLLLLAAGHPSKEIARHLGLSLSTVKTHLATAYRVLGARNRVEAVMRLQQGPPVFG